MKGERHPHSVPLWKKKFCREKRVHSQKMHEEETVIGEIGAEDNTKSVLQLETRYLSQASRLSFAASRSLTFQSKCDVGDEHQRIWVFTNSGRFAVKYHNVQPFSWEKVVVRLYVGWNLTTNLYPVSGRYALLRWRRRWKTFAPCYRCSTD